MTAPLLALSLSSSFTKVGAIAAFLALVGIAVLSLLVFSQAREIKRLRDWAGRAPERAAELEQRVSADAAARMLADRRPQGSPVGGSAPAAPQGRVVPRETPLVSAPVSSAVSASAAAVAPSAGGAQPAAAAQAASSPRPTAVSQSDAQPGASAQPASAARSIADQAEPDEPAEPTAQSAAAPAQPAPPGEKQGERPAVPPPPATAAAQGATRAGEVGGRSPAARDHRSAPRSPLPPSPQAPKPSPPRSGAIAAARATPPRVAGPRPRASTMPATSAATVAGAAAAIGGGRKDYRPERSPVRAIVLGAGIVVVLVLVAIFAVSALKGGGGSASTANQGVSGGARSAASHHHSHRSTAANPGSVSVAVLNGTATAGLAHHLASDLKESGYTRALASAAVPPGTHQTTVVEYSSGHRADAKSVAKALNVTQVEPMESTVSGMAGPAMVVVLAGADQAALLGGGGAHSQGEPAAGGTATGRGEAAAGQ